MKNLFVFLALLLATPILFAEPGNVAKPDTVNKWFFWKAEGENQDSTWTYLTDSNAISGKSSQVFGLRSYGVTKYYWVKKLDKKYIKPPLGYFWLYLDTIKTERSDNFLQVSIFLGNSEKLSDITQVNAFGLSNLSQKIKFFITFDAENLKADSLDVVIFCLNTTSSVENTSAEFLIDDFYFYKDILIDDGGEPKYPQFRVAKLKIDFGAVAKDSTKLDSVTVTNTGDAPLVISKLWTDDSSFSAHCSTITIAPQASTNVVVKFAQDSVVGAKKSYLRIEHNGLSKLDSVELTADFLVLVPKLEINKTKINFGATAQGKEKSDSVSICNIGEASLVVSRVWTDNPAFSAKISNSEISPLDSTQVMVEFKQDSIPGLKKAKLYIEHNASGKLDSVELVADFMTSVKDKNFLPNEFNLSQNYPNPFNPSTSIKYSVSSMQYVRLTVYDMLGREVAILVDGERNAGEHSVNFNAEGFSSGTYIYRLQAESFIATKKMVLLK
jgi:hypothetical protein